jgi:protein-arginine kinase activator protein McsA
MLCDICHERDATIHTTTTRPEGVSDSHLCRECFHARGPIVGAQLVEGAEKTCHYCGADCKLGGFGSQAVSILIPGAISCCRECGDDLQQYFAGHLSTASTEEDLTHDLETYMKTQIAKRRS